MEHSLRKKAITRTSIIGILANLILAAFKAGAGLLSGSVAIVLDALNNLTDALSSVITIVGVKLAAKRPNARHPFGYGRMEYFSTLLISVLILYAGVTSLIEAVNAIIHPELPDYSAVTILIVIVSVGVKLFLGWYVKKQGKRYNSDALVASGSDAALDALSSASTLLPAVVALLFHISIDGIIAAVIAVLILRVGMEMLFSSIGSVLGNRSDSEISKSIKSTVRSVPGVLGAFDLVLHNYGPDHALGSIHVEIPDTMTAADIHRMTMQIQDRISEKFHIFLTVGIYAVDQSDPEKVAMREEIIRLCTALDGAINAHGIRIDSDAMRIKLDITVDFSVHDKDAFCREAAQKIEAAYPDYTVLPSLDTNYSD